MRRRLLAIGFGFALAVIWAWPAAADQNVRIRGVDPKDFPEVAVTVSVQGSTGLQPDEARVLENGVAVEVTAVRPLGQSDHGVDVVLVIDTSNSMRGLPLQTAFAAARQFVTQVPPWVRVGLVTFDDRPEVVEPVTSDHQAVMQSLATLPPTGLGTALYDAVATASGMFTGTAQRNIILLTDGRNTAGTADLQTAAAAAGDAHATIFSVGLEGADMDVAVLQDLSRLTSGTYVSVSPNDLGAAYRALATQLSQQYLITYRSKAPYGTQVTLSVELPGGADETGFLAPAPHTIASNAGNPTELERFFRSTLGLAIAVGLTFLAAFGLISFLFGVQAQADRERQLAKRIPAPPRSRATTSPRPEGNPLTAWIPQTVVGAAGRVAQYTGLAAGLDARLEQAGLAMRPGEFLAGIAAAAVAGGLVGGLVSRKPVGAAVVAALGAALPLLLLLQLASRRVHQIQAQLPDVLMVIASSLRAGHSFMQALDMVTKEVGEPSAHEFTRVVTEVRLGRPVDQALDAMADRIGNDDFRWAVMAINIQRQVGGNLAELLETVANTIRERETLRRQVRVLSAEGRLSVVVLTVLPLFMVAYILLVVPSYIQTLFQRRIGIMLLVAAGVLMVIGHFWMRRIVKPNV